MLSQWIQTWDPALAEIISVIKQVDTFPLLELERVPTWVSGHVALMGDAAHATTPYLGQGAAMGVEDALVLGTMICKLVQQLECYRMPLPKQIDLKCQLTHILHAYASLQQPRTMYIVAQSYLAGLYNHLDAGPRRRERDAAFAAFDPKTCPSDYGWISSEFNDRILGRRTEQAAEAEFKRVIDQGLLYKAI